MEASPEMDCFFETAKRISEKIMLKRKLGGKVAKNTSEPR
jgi:hypothetical protein